MEHRMMNGTSQRMKRFTTNNNTTTKREEETRKAKQELGIDGGDMKGEKNTSVKHRVNNKIKEWFKERIEKREQQQIQSWTPIGRDKQLGAPKRGPTIWKSNKAPGQHHLQSQIKNAPS